MIYLIIQGLSYFILPRTSSFSISATYDCRHSVNGNENLKPIRAIGQSSNTAAQVLEFTAFHK